MKITVLLTAMTVVFAFLTSPVLAGNNKGTIIAAHRAHCHELVDPKHLTGAPFKAEFSKCYADPDNYK
jgi:hypothetical protein